MNVSLRDLTEADAPLIVKWRNRPDVRKWFWRTEKVTLESHKLWFKDYRNDSSQYRWIIMHGSKPVGSVGFTDRFTNSASLTIYIGEPSARGKGVATKALELALTEARKLGLYYIYAEMRPNNHAAIALYDKCGFRISTKCEGWSEMTKELD